MTSTRKCWEGLAAAVAVAVIALTGLSGAEAASPAERLPDNQQNLTFVPNFGVPSLDSAMVPLEMGTNQIMSNVLQALVTLDKKSIPQPQLATSWKWTTPTSLQFKLREGVTFSDGQPFTSADVVGSFDRFIAKKATLSAALSIITSYTADDPTTFTINTSAPTGTLLGVLSLVKIGQGTHSTDDVWWGKPIGTGPFVITSYVANDHVKLTRNDTYWGEKAKLKTLTFSLITDTNAKITALANGQAHVLGDVIYDQFPTVKAMENVTLTPADALTYYFLWFNNAKSPLTDPKVRRAMWMALDLPTIVQSLYGETASPMDSFCPSSAFGCVTAADMPSYDPKGAKALLAEAGYPNGLTADILLNTSNAGMDTLVSAFVSQWKAVGITVKPRAQDPTTWLADFSAHNWDMVVNPNATITGDADYTLNRLYNCAANRLGYCNPKLDALFTKAQQSSDPSERTALYQQAVNIMAQDAPGIPMFQTKSNVAALKSVQDLSIPPTEFIDWSTVYLTK
ncbi:ABC transporter substrate-binding protein [Microvirga puerhi]|uniref:ABC transporter substrate-binding protein n=1 Tax=Microvirga puerhi TaxID=2876078 RepID=A0ABS7VSW5_9HYPH|nr:ABC transporter substrate-binding protein [Microvirga puerhi]MBZ6078205.1 ABC transporter substrate-binding protein [Microvirga puerhi]